MLKRPAPFSSPPVLVISCFMQILEACVPYFRPLFRPAPVCALLGRNKDAEPTCIGAHVDWYNFRDVVFPFCADCEWDSDVLFLVFKDAFTQNA